MVCKFNFLGLVRISRKRAEDNCADSIFPGCRDIHFISAEKGELTWQDAEANAPGPVVLPDPLVLIKNKPGLPKLFGSCRKSGKLFRQKQKARICLCRSTSGRRCWSERLLEKIRVFILLLKIGYNKKTGLRHLYPVFWNG